MRNFFKMFSLQFFADGASGEGTADSASSGETAAAAGQPTGDTTAAAGQEEETQADRLERLGVPKEKAEKYRARKANRIAANASSAMTAASQEKEEVNGTDDTGSQQDAAASDGQDQQNTEPAMQDWDTLMKNPELNRKMQDTVRARVKPLQARIEGFTPILELLGRHYGIDTSDPSKVDMAALAKAVGDDDYFYEEESSELGLDVPATKKRVQQELELNARDRALKQREDALSESLEEMTMRRHVEKMNSDAAALKKSFKDFDLQKELQNPRFAAMVSPGGGLSVTEAYYAIHHREIEEAKEAETARNVAKAFSNSIQSGRHLPVENGMNSRNPSPAPNKSYRQMTAAERAEYKARIQREAAMRKY